jgi:hypothetical protein
MIAWTTPQDLPSFHARHMPWRAHGRRLRLRRLHHREPRLQLFSTLSNAHDKHRRQVHAIPIVFLVTSAIQFRLSRGCGATPPAVPLSTWRITRQRSIGTRSSSASPSKTMPFTHCCRPTICENKQLPHSLPWQAEIRAHSPGCMMISCPTSFRLFSWPLPRAAIRFVSAL